MPSPFWRHPCLVLLVFLALTLILYPFSDTQPLMGALAQAIEIVVVLLLVRMLRLHHRWLKGGWFVCVPLLVAQVANLLAPGHVAVMLPMLLLQVVFHAAAALMLLGYVLDDDTVTIDELYALACIYVLLALLWASAYGIVTYFNPTAIFINPSNDPDGRVGWSDLVYFSLTTLTSTGYGEITPVSPPARALAMLQQTVGVLFVAMLISRLTGMSRHGAGAKPAP